MTSRAVVSLRVAATPDRAFEVFTREIGTWWVYNPEFRLTPRSPGRMAFEQPSNEGTPARLVEVLPNGKTFVVGAVRVWEPGSRLVMDWRQATFGPEHATEVEVRFELVGDDTRITVEHRGWESVPQEHVARHGFALPVFLQRQGAYWKTLLASVNQQIT